MEVDFGNLSLNDGPKPEQQLIRDVNALNFNNLSISCNYQAAPDPIVRRPPSVPDVNWEKISDLFNDEYEEFLKANTNIIYRGPFGINGENYSYLKYILDNILKNDKYFERVLLEESDIEKTLTGICGSEYERNMIEHSYIRFFSRNENERIIFFCCEGEFPCLLMYFKDVPESEFDAARKIRLCIGCCDSYLFLFTNPFVIENNNGPVDLYSEDFEKNRIDPESIVKLLESKLSYF